MPDRICKAPDCDRGIVALGFCDSHYRMAKGGKPLRPIRVMGMTVPDRFWSKVNKAGPIPRVRAAPRTVLALDEHTVAWLWRLQNREPR